MNAAPWKDGDEPLTPIEELAATILKTAYVKRVQSIVDAQLAGGAPRSLRMDFHEPSLFGYVVAALEKARQIGVMDACTITVRHVDATYGDKKVNKALAAVNEIAQTGGLLASRTRISDARQIIRDRRSGDIEWNGNCRASAYRYVPVLVPTHQAEQMEMFQ